MTSCNSKKRIQKSTKKWTLLFAIFLIFWCPNPPKMEPKSLPKSVFGLLFGDAFFDYVLGLILYQFWEAPTLKNINFTKEKQGFSVNRRFQESYKKSLIFTPIWIPKTPQMVKKTSSNTSLFGPSFWGGVFFDFDRLWLHFGRPLGHQKAAKNAKKR